MNELAPRPSQPCQQIPHGLVSLWAMLDFHAASFVTILNTMTSIERKLVEDRTILHTADHSAAPILSQQLRWLQNKTLELGLPVTHAAIGPILWGIENHPKYQNNPVSVGNQILTAFQNIRERLADELASKAVYLIPVGTHLEKGDGFGEAVAEAFPSATYDIIEAGKCLMFSRSTACVMHLMRVMELGLTAMASQLGVDASTDNWNTLLNRIEAEIRSRTTETHGSAWKEIDEPFYAEAATHFRFAKNGWRNHVMHARSKYTPEEADDIYRSVKGLMRHLSKRLSEPSA